MNVGEYQFKLVVFPFDSQSFKLSFFKRHDTRITKLREIALKIAANENRAQKHYKGHLLELKLSTVIGGRESRAWQENERKTRNQIGVWWALAHF